MAEEVSDELMPSFDDVMLAAPVATAVPGTEILPAQPEWPGLAWEKNLLTTLVTTLMACHTSAFTPDLDISWIQLRLCRHAWPQRRRVTIRPDRHAPAAVHGREAGPEVVEEARAERELGLEAVGMGRDADVGLEEQRAALLERNPRQEVHSREKEPLRGGHVATRPASTASPPPTKVHGPGRSSKIRIAESGSENSEWMRGL